VLLSTYDSRGGVEPLAALGVRLLALGAEVLVCAPPDCAERLAEVGVPLVPAGEPVRALVHGATPPSAAGVPRRAAELIAGWFDKVAAAAEGCDALVASGVIPASRAQDCPEPRGPRTSGRHGRRDPHRRGHGGREAAARGGQPGKAAGARVLRSELMA